VNEPEPTGLRSPNIVLILYGNLQASRSDTSVPSHVVGHITLCMRAACDMSRNGLTRLSSTVLNTYA